MNSWADLLKFVMANCSWQTQEIVKADPDVLGILDRCTGQDLVKAITFMLVDGATNAYGEAASVSKVAESLAWSGFDQYVNGGVASEDAMLIARALGSKNRSSSNRRLVASSVVAGVNTNMKSRARGNKGRSILCSKGGF